MHAPRTARTRDFRKKWATAAGGYQMMIRRLRRGMDASCDHRERTEIARGHALRHVRSFRAPLEIIRRNERIDCTKEQQLHHRRAAGARPRVTGSSTRAAAPPPDR